MYIPKINLPLEGVEHARWLERRSIEQGKQIERLQRLVDSLAKANSAGSRAAVVEAAASGGVPMPPLTGGVVRGSAPNGLRWTTEWQGFLPEYYVYLDPVNGSGWDVVSMGVGGDTSYLGSVSKALLPPVEFDDGGATMLPIKPANFFDAPATGAADGQSPLFLYVDVYPADDGDEFTIHVPDPANATGVSAPFYKFQVNNPTFNDAIVHVIGGGFGSSLFYAGTRVPVMGSQTSWAIPAGGGGSWHVEVHNGNGAVAIPSSYNNGGSYGFTDQFFEEQVASMAHMFPFAKDGPVSVGVLPRVFVNDTATAIRFGKVRATVGTAPTGAALTVDVLVEGVVAGTVTIAAGETSGVLERSGFSDVEWRAGDRVTAEVTQVGSTVSGSDLTVQVWAG